MLVTDLCAEVAQADEVKDGDEVADGVEATRVTHLASYGSHGDARAAVGTATRTDVIATPTYTLLPLA